MNTSIRGGYFPYCQFCEHDGRCELKHHEYLGVPAGPGVDRTPYDGHQDLRWSHMMAQDGTTRAMCTGKIGKTGSLFYPLACECASVVPSSVFGGVCAKLIPNEKGRARIALIEARAAEKGINPHEVSADELPPLDPSYRSELFL